MRGTCTPWLGLSVSLSSFVCGARTRAALATPVAYIGVEGEGRELRGVGCLRTRHVSFVSPRVRLFNHFNLKPKLKLNLKLLLS